MGKLFFGDPDSDLSHKNQRFLLIFYQFSDGILKIQICFRMQGIPEPDNAAFGNFDSLDHIKPGIHGIPELFQAMVDLSGDQLQLFLLPCDHFFLMDQLFFDHIGITVIQKSFDLGEWKIQDSEITYGVEKLKLSGAIIPVSSVRVCIFRC